MRDEPVQNLPPRPVHPPRPVQVLAQSATAGSSRHRSIPLCKIHSSVEHSAGTAWSRAAVEGRSGVVRLRGPLYPCPAAHPSHGAIRQHGGDQARPGEHSHHHNPAPQPRPPAATTPASNPTSTAAKTAVRARQHGEIGHGYCKRPPSAERGSALR